MPPVHPANDHASVAKATSSAAPAGSFIAAPFIREIGRGAKGARSLTRNDAFALFEAMLDGRIDELELGAILMAYRVKGETPDELAGMLDAAHARCLRMLPVPKRMPVVIPCYNGARKQPNLVPLLALLLARDGIPVLLHGVRDDAGRVTTAEVLRALDIAPCESADDAVSALAQNSIAFLPIERLCPALARLLACRSRMGLRNSAHTLVKLLQPFGDHGESTALRLVNYTHPEYLASLSALFTRIPANVLLARGTEGEAVADARRSTRIDWLHSGSAEMLVAPQEGPLGTLPELPEHLGAEITARWIRRALLGEAPIPAPLLAQREAIHQALRM